ncbi:hypothetical protein GCM10023183_13260 [Nibribacter koreensis]|uniref:Uncharacterized protein n=1 Tax=Nibribacter koreensis TaxID=1084519 RepID=A0ABP8FEM5_9BACT
MKLSKVASFKYSVHSQEPFLFSNPVEKLKEENLHPFLDLHESVIFNYEDAEKVELKHSWWNKNKLYFTAKGKQYNFGILERGKSHLYEEWLSETFQDKFSVEGTYTM